MSQSLWHELLSKKMSRRTMIQSAVAAGAASGLQVVNKAEAVSNNGAPVIEVSNTPSGILAFSPIEMSRADSVTLPSGYSFQVVAPWGEKINEAGDTIGFNHDYVGLFPIDMLTGGTSTTDFLMTINHEYPNALFVGGNVDDPSAPDQVEAQKKSVGVSIVRVKKEATGWVVVMDPHNRRIDAKTDIELTGPVASTELMAGAKMVKGTVGNCSGGQTPWGTLLTCEENVDDYAEVWGSDYNPMHQGWVTEIDPFESSSTPKKRTALGRFRHENAAVTIAKDGRVVVYMGDDKRGACVYKFVSKGIYNPADRAANMTLLETGDLYVANFGKGQWLLLDVDKNEDFKEAVNEEDGTPLFKSQAEVLADARSSALAIGATPVDRPEDIEIHPKTGDVYMAFTNNSEHGNYYGQIIKLTEASSDWIARTVVAMMGAKELELVHNHHNFAWKETHDGNEYIVVRKGATPAFPEQKGFVGGSMGDNAVILQGAATTDAETKVLQASALYSTVHGAGRVMSRTEAAGKWDYKRKVRKTKGKISAPMMKAWLKEKAVILRGGGLDEAPQAYRRLPDVIASQGPTIEVLHILKPLIVVMAGENEFDPYKD
jgi:uncharacterized protein